MAQIDELRLMTKVARMYYEREMRQSDIARQLGLSQATISRLFKRAKEEGIVRISIASPPGVYAHLEEILVDRYGLQDALVVDCAREGDEAFIERDIGAAAAYYLETTVGANEVIGLSSWSATLLALVDAMHQVPRRSDVRVVQILGGVGNPTAERHANRLTGRLASLLNGTAAFLPAPGIVGSEAALEVFLDDPYVRETMSWFDEVTMALVGIGTIEPSSLLANSGNIFTPEELGVLREKKAVGDVLLRFFDGEGQPVDSSLDRRVVSMTLEQLKAVKRSVGVAGGSRKYEAVRGALRGGLINVLITDCVTAARLVEETELSSPADSPSIPLLEQ